MTPSASPRSNGTLEPIAKTSPIPISTTSPSPSASPSPTASASASPSPTASGLAPTLMQQSINFTAPTMLGLAQGTYSLNAPTATSGLTPSVNSNTPSVCTISGLILTFASVGTCTLTASQSGNSRYAAAPIILAEISIVSGPKFISSPRWNSSGGTPLIVGNFASLTNRGSTAMTPFGTWTGNGTIYYSASFTICGVPVSTSTTYTGEPRTPEISPNQQRCEITATITARDSYGSTTQVLASTIAVADAFNFMSAGSLNYQSGTVVPGTSLSSSGATWGTYLGGIIPTINVSRCPTNSLTVNCVTLATGLPNSWLSKYVVTLEDVGSYIVFTSVMSYGNVTKQGAAGTSPLISQ